MKKIFNAIKRVLSLKFPTLKMANSVVHYSSIGSTDGKCTCIHIRTVYIGIGTIRPGAQYKRLRRFFLASFIVRGSASQGALSMQACTPRKKKKKKNLAMPSACALVGLLACFILLNCNRESNSNQGTRYLTEI